MIFGPRSVFGFRAATLMIVLLVGGCPGFPWLSSAAAEETQAGSSFARRHPGTMKSLRWNGVVHQAFDYSCGTGSIANLINLTGGQAPEENTIINGYIQMRGLQAVQDAMQNGFSLLDLKRMMKSLGHETAGMRYEAGTMPEDPQPMIVYLVVKGYRHFSVFAGIEQGQVVLIDPSRGRIRLTHERFLSEWDGTALCFAGLETHATLPNDETGFTRAQETARSGLFRRR